MEFEEALVAVKCGKWVERAGWNGSGMYLFLIGGSPESVWTYTNGRNDNFPLSPFVAIKSVNDVVVPWFPSQTDILAKDWRIVE